MQTIDLDELADTFGGQVVGPLDPDYAATAQPWNLAWTHRPAAVVRPRDEDDVRAALAFARRHRLSVAVQATGHGVTVAADESTLLVDVSGLDRVSIDPSAGTATVGGGSQWGPVLAAAQEHGLAPLLGSAPHVGAVGYSLGGGFGWLARRHGLAVDSVGSLRVVLPDGRTVTASTEEETELFWALCGAGGGSLGVVVEMEVGLVPVAQVYAGNLLYPLEDAHEVFAFYRDWIVDVPAEMTCAFNITAFPPLEMVPEPLRGRTFVIVRGCHCGDLAEGEALVEQWRRWRAPAIDMWGPMPFSACAAISQDPVDPVPAGSSGRWLDRLAEDLVDTLLAAVAGGDSPSPVLFVETRMAGGAVARPNPAVSFAARSGGHTLEVVGMVMSPEADLELEARTRQVWRSVSADLAALPGYVNFTEGQERVEMARHAFDEDTKDRLARVKRRVDPEAVFRHGLDLVERPVAPAETRVSPVSPAPAGT